MIPLRRASYCLLTGAGFLLGLEPFGFHAAALVAPLGAIALSRSLRRSSYARVLGWSLAFACAVQVIALPWIMIGLMNIARLSAGAALPIYFLHIPIYSLRFPFFFLGAHFVRRQTRIPMLYVYPALALAGDLWIFQNFPLYWGSLTAGNETLRQVAALLGGPGAAVVVFAEASLLYLALVFLKRRRLLSNRRFVRRILPGAALSVCVVLGAALYGSLRADPARSATGELTLGLFQSNPGPAREELRNDPEYAGRALNLFFNLGLKAIVDGGGRLDLLVAPESAVPFFGTEPAPDHAGLYSPTFRGVVAFLARYGDVNILYNELTPATDTTHYYNTASLFDRHGQRTSYRKQKLVPFGEYIPFEAQMPFLRSVFPEVSRYVPASAQAPLHFDLKSVRETRSFQPPDESALRMLEDPEEILAAWPERVRAARTVYLAPLVCYEGLFPGLVRDLFDDPDKQPALLVNLTNDSWFGERIENHQHQDQARFRAIETGRFLVRANLSGLSTVFDAFGRPIAPPMAVGEVGVRLFRIPLVQDYRTGYLLWGDAPLYLWLSILTLIAWIRRRS